MSPVKSLFTTKTPTKTPLKPEKKAAPKISKTTVQAKKSAKAKTAVIKEPKTRTTRHSQLHSTKKQIVLKNELRAKAIPKLPASKAIKKAQKFKAVN